MPCESEPVRKRGRLSNPSQRSTTPTNASAPRRPPPTNARAHASPAAAAKHPAVAIGFLRDELDDDDDDDDEDDPDFNGDLDLFENDEDDDSDYSDAEHDHTTSHEDRPDDHHLTPADPDCDEYDEEALDAVVAHLIEERRHTPSAHTHSNGAPSSIPSLRAAPTLLSSPHRPSARRPSSVSMRPPLRRYPPEPSIRSIQTANRPLLPPLPSTSNPTPLFFEVDNLDSGDDEGEDPLYHFSDESDEDPSDDDESDEDDSLDHYSDASTIDDDIQANQALPSPPISTPQQQQIHPQPIQTERPSSLAPPKQTKQHQIQTQPNTTVSRATETPLPTAPDNDDEDDPNDPDYQALIPEAELEDVDLDPRADARNADYIKFLMGLSVDDNVATDNQMGLPGGTEPANEGDNENALLTSDNSNHSIPLNVMDMDLNATGQDDDDDFDYLKESTKFRDDPLEYREDLTVPIKEVIQLLSQNDAPSGLRPQTRASKAKRVSLRRANKPAQSVPVLEPANANAKPKPVVPTPVLPGPGPSGLTMVPPLLAPPMGAVAAGEAAEGPCAAYLVVRRDKMARFQQQLVAHVQIATHVHSTLARQVRAAAVVNEGADGDADEESAIAVACKRSSEMLGRLVIHACVSRNFHWLLTDRLSALRPIAERMLGGGVSRWNVYTSRRTGAMDIPLVHAIDGFLNEVSSPQWDGGDAALDRLKVHWRDDVAAGLRRQRPKRYPSGGFRDGVPPWSGEDDLLLAMTIAKYGREFDDMARDLLPHRGQDDCHSRVRYLSSRRCGDNVVKRQFVVLNSPLNRDELRLVQEGLKRFGEASDSGTWKRIQRELLPAREWSHLQKLWLWRESRRKYKANYRAKVNGKKRTDGGGAPSSLSNALVVVEPSEGANGGACGVGTSDVDVLMKDEHSHSGMLVAGNASGVGIAVHSELRDVAQPVQSLDV